MICHATAYQEHKIKVETIMQNFTYYSPLEFILVKDKLQNYVLKLGKMKEFY